MSAADAIASPQSFDLFLGALMSQDETQRGGAEAAFEQLKNQPDALCGNFLIAMRQAQSSEKKQFAAIMLRRVLCKDDPPLWTKCSAAVQASDLFGRSLWTKRF
jgi:hypothetical protein